MMFYQCLNKVFKIIDIVSHQEVIKFVREQEKTNNNIVSKTACFGYLSVVTEITKLTQTIIITMCRG